MDLSDPHHEWAEIYHLWLTVRESEWRGKFKVTQSDFWKEVFCIWTWIDFWGPRQPIFKEVPLLCQTELSHKKCILIYLPLCLYPPLA